MRWIVGLVLVFGCVEGASEQTAVDSDGDGITDAEEQALGLDANAADSDGDGLSDGDELALGSDPLSTDTDDDTYADGDEVAEGTDPADAESRIYLGYWPYARDKDDADHGDLGGVLAPGERIGRFVGKDQFGDRVDLYDFLHDGVPVVIDVSAVWCPPCNQLSLWLDGGLPAYDDYWPGVRQAVKRGDVRWITVLGEDNDFGPATGATVAAWDAAYPHDRIPVLADKNQEIVRHVGLTGWPTLRLLDADLRLVEDGGGTYGDVLDVLSSQL
ncbi:MAG: hypothetical protein ACI8PZ_001865 [Myxococcota bacterium]|jgi:hypothetical protein